MLSSNECVSVFVGVLTVCTSVRLFVVQQDDQCVPDYVALNRILCFQKSEPSCCAKTPRRTPQILYQYKK